MYTTSGMNIDRRPAGWLILSALHTGLTDRRREQQATNRARDRTLTVGRREKMMSSCRSRNAMTDNPAAVSRTYTMTNVNDCAPFSDKPSAVTDADTLPLSSCVKCAATT